MSVKYSPTCRDANVSSCRPTTVPLMTRRRLSIHSPGSASVIFLNTCRSYRTGIGVPLPPLGVRCPLPEGFPIRSNLVTDIQGTTFPSEEESQRALELARNRRCPHCGDIISLRDVICMLNGEGVERWILVQLENGNVEPIKMGEVNPQRVRIIEP